MAAAGACALAAIVPLSAQQDMNYLPLPGPVKDAGVYHVATGTWSHGPGQELGAKILYDNSANSGAYGVSDCGALWWTDEGRVPSTTGHPNATADSYVVSGFRFAYCSNITSGPMWGFVRFFECYDSCTNPIQLSPIFDLQFNLPGGITDSSCWLVGFDLTGVAFEIAGDCDGVFDDDPALDDFGFEIALGSLGGQHLNGPILAGDPDQFPPGDGTYYQNEHATVGTGLSTLDQFWAYGDEGCNANGCFWFGGYSAGEPYGSFWLTLYGDVVHEGMEFTKYCTSNPNSTGSPADLAGSGTGASAGDVRLTSTPVPDESGVFFHGAHPAQFPFGNGYQCVTGGIVRGATVVAQGNVADYVYDRSDAKHSLDAFVGSTRYFQHWFRDPAGGGAAFSTSNAVYAVVLP